MSKATQHQILLVFLGIISGACQHDDSSETTFAEKEIIQSDASPSDTTDMGGCQALAWSTDSSQTPYTPDWWNTEVGYRRRLVMNGGAICGTGSTGALYCWGAAQGITGSESIQRMPPSGPSYTVYPVVKLPLQNIVDISINYENFIFPTAVDSNGILWWWSHSPPLGKSTEFPTPSGYEPGRYYVIDVGGHVRQAAPASKAPDGEPTILARIDSGMVSGVGDFWPFLGQVNARNESQEKKDVMTIHKHVLGDISDVVQLVSGWSFYCGIRRNHQVLCWGYSDAGFPTEDDEIAALVTPLEVSLLQNSIHLSASVEASCAVKSDGSLWCWGYAEDGSAAYFVQPPPYLRRPKPVPCVTDARAVEVSSNGFRCILHADGTVYCSFVNISGEEWGVYPGNYFPAGWPGSQVAGIPEPIVEIAASFDCACALGESDAVYCWGDSTCRGEASDGKWSDEAVLVTRLK